jgi:hypothetical protein
MNTVRVIAMKTPDRIVAGCLLVSVLAVAAAGCGRKEEPEAETPKPTVQGAPGDAASPAGAAVDQAPRMANAVPTSTAGAAVDLQYEIAPRPEAGQPFEIELSFAPLLPADTLDVQLSATPGLRITSTETIRFDAVQVGQRYSSKASVIGDAPGLYYVGIVVRMATKVQTDARSFSIPVVVGTEPPATTQPTPAVEAEGKPIEPTAAVESGRYLIRGRPAWLCQFCSVHRNLGQNRYSRPESPSQRKTAGELVEAKNLREPAITWITWSRSKGAVRLRSSAPRAWRCVWLRWRRSPPP